MSYINTFGGGTVQSSNTSYSPISTQLANIVLQWPNAFQDTANVVYDFMNITSGGTVGTNITLPAANLSSVGISFVFNNVGPNAIQIIDGGGNNLQLINAGAVYEFYLTNNTTAGGLWSIIPFGGGAAGVTSFTSVQPAAGLTVVQNQNTGAIIQTFTLANALASLQGLVTTGYGARIAADTWATRTFQAGNGNITLTNPDGVAGNTTIMLNNALTGLTSVNVGNMTLSANMIQGTQVNQNLIIAPNGTGELQSNNNINIQSGNQLKFYNAANTFYTGILGGNAAANTSYTLPLAYPVANNQVLGSTTAGVMSWLNAVVSPGATTTNAIAKYLNTMGQLSNSGVIIDNFNNITGATSDIIQNIGIGTIAAIAGSGTNSISAQNAGGSIVLIPNGAGQVQSVGGFALVRTAPAVASGVFFNDGANTNAVGLIAQNAAMVASTTYTLPNAGPTVAGQLLTSTVPVANASTMSWKSPAVIQVIRNNSNVTVNSNAVIPSNNAIPQIGQGTQVITATITPTNAANTLLIEFNCSLISANAPDFASFTLFRDLNANALCTNNQFVANANNLVSSSFKYYTAAGATAATTFSVRFGPANGNTIYLLSNSAGTVTYGGTPIITLTVTELTP